jgi:hypothetical protein
VSSTHVRRPFRLFDFNFTDREIREWYRGMVKIAMTAVCQGKTENTRRASAAGKRAARLESCSLCKYKAAAGLNQEESGSLRRGVVRAQGRHGECSKGEAQLLL